MHLVAIGGGDQSVHETFVIDRYIMEHTGKENPKVLFVPTASEDSPQECLGMERYLTGLGAEVDHLLLLKSPPSAKELVDLVDSFDVVYIGGGNTRLLSDTLKKTKADLAIRKAAARGVIVAGYSAGANVLFEYGTSLEVDRKKGNLTLVKIPGMGLIKGVCSPHFDNKQQGPLRSTGLLALLDEAETAVCISEGSAFVVKDSEYMVLKSGDQKGFRGFKEADELMFERIDGADGFSSCEAVYLR